MIAEFAVVWQQRALMLQGFMATLWISALASAAALAMGMRRGVRFRRIVLPQVARAALPALVNELTLLVKVSPAIAVLGVVDITRAAVRIGAQTYDPLPPFMVALVIYSSIVFLFVRVQRVVERRYA